jgi:hypothetical protein
VSQFANATFAKEITDRTWTISLADVDMFVGSNSLTGS